MVDIPSQFRLIGRGVYSLAEASRLSGVPAKTLHRWAQGYRYTRGGQRRFSTAILGTGLPQRADEPIFEFRDIMEARFLSAFRRSGVKWTVIRRVAANAHTILETTHPFATRLFRTDGRTILLQQILKDEDDAQLIDLLQNQYEWNKLVETYLVKEKVDFNLQDEPTRWWPLGPSRQVVVDAERAFGAPIVPREGVQTYLLSKAVGVEGDIDYVANWFHVTSEAVRDAVAFEQGLRAAA
jgi:uncharacterized protein (DUF433 family)